MASVQDFKDLVGRLKTEEPTGRDIAAFKELASQLTISLRAAFRYGNPMPPEERVRKARVLIGLATIALALRFHEPVATIFRELLQDLDEAAEASKEGLDRFLARSGQKSEYE